MTRAAPQETGVRPERRNLALTHGASLEISDDGDTIILFGEMGGAKVYFGHVATDALLRFLGPACGLLPADYRGDGPDATRKAMGPVCVGGPYDGKRLPRSMAPRGVVVVPVLEPQRFYPAWPGSQESIEAVSYHEAQYRLIPLHAPLPNYDERDLWWYIPPKSRSASSTTVQEEPV